MNVALGDHVTIYVSVEKNSAIQFSTDPTPRWIALSVPSAPALAELLSRQLIQWLNALTHQERRRINTSTPIGSMPAYLTGFRLECQYTRQSPHLYGTFMPAWV